MKGTQSDSRPDDRLIGTPRTAQERTDGIIRKPWVHDQTQTRLKG